MGKIRRAPLLFCLVGPAGGGKTTLRTMMLEKNPATMMKSISMTTRPPRPHEKEGIDYSFVTRDRFETLRGEDRFFEWEEVHGNLYGTPRETVDTALTEGKDLIFDIDIAGALSLKLSYPNQTIIIFIVPVEKRELKERLLRRGSSPEEIERRLLTAEKEYAAFLSSTDKIDYLLVNSQISESVQCLAAFLESERSRVQRLSREDLMNFLSKGE